MQMAVAEPAEGGTEIKKLYFLPQMDIVILKKCFIEIHLGMGRDILAPLLFLSHKYLSRQTQAYFCRDKRRVLHEAEMRKGEGMSECSPPLGASSGTSRGYMKYYLW